MKTAILLTCFCVALTGCSFGGGEDGAIGDIPTWDGAVDAAADAKEDAGQSDTATDAVDAGPVDAGPVDVGPGDVGPGDVGPEDVPEDTAWLDAADTQDGSGDTAPDAGLDIMDDADTASDVALDVIADTVTPPFGAQVPVSGGTDYESGELHAMTVNDLGQVSVFWRGVNEANSVDLLVSVSDPWAASFADPVVVKAGLAMQGITSGGDMEQSGSTYYFVWRDKSANGDGQVFFRKTSQADLAGTDVLMMEASNGEELWRPYLVRGWQGALCTIWQQDKDVKIRCSDDDGESWADTLPVDAPGMLATVSSAAFNNDNQLVVALQAGGLGANQITVQRSADLGANWEDATDVDGVAIVGGSVSQVLGETNYLHPTLIRTMTGKLKLAWHRPLPGIEAEAHMSSSTDGLSWSAPALLPSIKSNVELVQGRGSSLHASGVEAKLGYGDTLYMSSPDEGTTWATANPIPVTPNALLLAHKIRANLVEGWLYIAWWETLPNNLIKQKLQLVTIEDP